MASAAPWTLLLVAHGTVSREEDLPEFLQEIRRGRPAPPELIAEMKHRYAAVGGSPLLSETRAQARALGEHLGLEARVAMRLWDPRVEDVLADLGEGDRVCLVPIAPFSVFVYEQAARESLAKLAHPPLLTCVEAWGQHPEVIRAWTEVTRTALPEDQSDCEVILTAHSLPQRVIDAGDPYASQFEAAATKVASGLPVRSEFAYQSQGAMAGAWLGPSLEDKIAEAKGRGVRKVVVSPIGFLTEHIETLFDLDIEARKAVEGAGLQLYRASTLRTSEGLIAGLADAARRAMAESR